MLVGWQLSRSGRSQVLVSSPDKVLAGNLCRSPLPGPFGPNSPSSLKRARHRTDVDGEGSEHFQKKKRRLRLNVTTSRLSKPYASPATHVNSRNTMRIGIWARQKFVGSNLLRKAAILNSIRIKKAVAREAKQKRLDLIELGFSSTDVDGFPTQQYIPSPSSPLGLSNYDAFDDEDDHLDGETDAIVVCETIYSDFSILDTTKSNLEDYASLSPFSDDEGEINSVTELGENIIELVMENEKYDEVANALSIGH